MHKAERGLFDLMRGQPLYVTAPNAQPDQSAVLVAAVEGLHATTIAELQRLGREPLRLALTDSRARAMCLVSAITAAATNGGTPIVRGSNGQQPPPLSLGLEANVTTEGILRLSTCVGKYQSQRVDLRGASDAEAAALALARIGRLLPAVVCAEVGSDAGPALEAALNGGEILEVTTSAIEAMSANSGLDVSRVTEAPVPLEEAEDARVVLFREADGLFEHVAILIGEPEDWPDPVPARLHSACLTGDLFGSLKCDCGEQLRGSLRVFGARGGGVLLYLAQEGRGIGLGNKLRAYALQESGLDTVDADCTLGFGADERTYEVAVRMLENLGINRVQLLTNNPEKVRALQKGGIEVVEREPLHGTLNQHNLPYVKAKMHRAGHWLEDMLSGKVPTGTNHKKK